MFDEPSKLQRERDEAVEASKQARFRLSTRRDAIAERGDAPISEAELAELKTLREKHAKLNARAEELTEQVWAEKGVGRTTKVVPGRPNDGPARAWARRAANAAMKGLDGGVSGSNASVVPSFVDPTIYTDPQLPVLVQGLVSQKVVDTGHVEGVTQTVRNSNAAIVEAGAAKPESTYEYRRDIIPVRVYAHVTLPYDRSLLMDGDFLVDLIGGELRAGVQASIEEALIAGDGVSPNPSGIIDAAGATTTLGGDTRADAILKAILNLRSDGFEPSHVLLSTADAQQMFLEKNDIGDYHWDFLPGGSGQFAIHGKPVVISSYVTTGTAVVADLPGSTVLYVREGARIDWAQAGWIDAGTDYDMFTHNELRARGEARVGIHVWRPSGIFTVTGF